MNNIIPIFYSDSSQKALNVWWAEKECVENGPVSIITLAKKAGLKEVYFVSSRWTDFISAWKLCNENNIQLIFGLELWICANPEDHSEASIPDESKVIIWMKNSMSYKDLIKLYSKIYTNINNKYYHFRGSWKILKEMWTENLMLSLPFFDSFLHRNTLNYGSNIIPDFPVKPTLFKEVNSGIPFAPLIENAIDNFNINSEYEIVNTKTIYYENYEDSKSWLVYKSIHNHSTYQKPEMEHCCSDKFCFQDFRKLTEVKV